MHHQQLRIFSGSSNPKLAADIAERLGVELGQIKLTRFMSGEIYVHYEESIRNCDVFLVQSLSHPINEMFVELLVMIDAAKRASARTVNIIVPYYGYARQERKSAPREPISAKMVADVLTTAGATRVITIDLHAAAIQGFFNIPIDHLMGVPILSDYFLERDDIDLTETVVVSPDHGGVTRARKMADRLKSPIAIIDKRRPKPNVAEVMNIVGDINGKTAIIIDDIIDTAGTITLAAQALIDKGAKEVYACCTHPVLSGPAYERIENSAIKELVVTNSIVLTEEQKPAKIKQLSVGELLAQAIIRVYEQESVSVLFD